MNTPLAERMRPKSLEEYLGQKHLIGANGALTPMLKNGNLPSMILWGPPGTGKTTLARLIADQKERPFYQLSAINSGVKEIREILQKAEHTGGLFTNKNPILFIDEIHRFSKSQQDSLLGAVEKGSITLIGATTENPSFEVINSLLSRCQVYTLNPLDKKQLQELISNTLKNQGIEVRYANHDNFQELEKLIDDDTPLVFCESIGNPLGNICDLEKLAELAHKNGVPLVVDNTVATPYLIKPIDYGANIVIHSLTKYISGHGTTIGGAIIDGGTFDWSTEPKRFPLLNEPDASYHGLIYTEALAEAAFIGRCRVGPLRNTGAALSPFNAFLILQGIQTLHVRMDRHCENTQKLAEYLEAHDSVEWVKYGGLLSSPYNELSNKYANGKPSGILSFGIKGGKESGIKFIDSLSLITRLVNIGDTKSLATHPASTTHSQLDESDFESAGISSDMIRISVGIENIDDIIADVDQAILESQKS